LANNTAPALFLDAELLANRIDSLVSRLEAADRSRPPQRGFGEDDASRDLSERLARTRTEYEATMARAASGDIAQLLGLTTVDAKRVQGSLDRDEALIDYLITRDTLITFIVRQDQIHVARTAIGEDRLNAQARVVRELFGARSAPTDASAASEALFDALIAPAQQIGALRAVSRLVIVPHEGLVYVPFAALRDRDTGRALVEQYVLAYLPSAAALPILRSRGGLVERGSRAAAAPPALALAPFTSELPATEAEARRFAARVPNALTRLGSDATERELRASLGSGGVVHIATHAELNVRNPMFSEIRLAPGSGARDDDGRLEVYEIFGIAVRSPLVFLSGCETGAGSAWSTDFQRGEDYATLARAFLYAGARNVIATLWRIDDEGAAELADRFYAYRSETDDAAALARAQRAMLRDTRYRSPYYWAGYQLSGAGR
jgi:CHAT domain-containing protein